jgi:uncharacterized cysteine cluster protein YcgN (CxxCxxCC family)
MKKLGAKSKAATAKPPAVVRKARAAKEKLPFWKTKTLEQMTSKEWESLCDGCGKCCTYKLEYEETGELAQTNVACRLFDGNSCRCSDYKDRKKVVPDCILLTPKVVRKMNWLPNTCAYRLVMQNKDLYWWHPLISGDPETVHQAGVSARGRVINELDAGPLEHHVVEWPDK